MQTLKATELLNNHKHIDNGDFEKAENISIDFSDVRTVDLNGIKRLLEIQKVAILNRKKLSLQNVAPELKNLFDITGVNKTFANLATNPIMQGR